MLGVIDTVIHVIGYLTVAFVVFIVVMALSSWHEERYGNVPKRDD